MHPRITALLTLVTVIASSPVLACAQEVKMQCGQPSIIVNEPLFVRVVLSSKDACIEPPGFSLTINGRATEPITDVGVAKVFRSDNGGGGCEYTGLWRLYLDAGGLVFPKPGKYELEVNELTTGAKAGPITIEVREGDDGDQEVGRALIDFHRGARDPRAREHGLRDVLEKYPISRLAKYARYILFTEIDIKHVPRATGYAAEEAIEIHKAYGKLALMYGDLSEVLPPLSEWHCNASFLLAICKSGGGDYLGSERLLSELDVMYGKHPSQGPRIRNSKESVARIIEDQKRKK